jgi:KDO2-lipid IV(A) lauroyltransferase
MDVHRLLSSHMAGYFGLGLARCLPPKAGFKFCDWIARRTATDSSLAFVQGIRSNQLAISGGMLDQAALDERVEGVLRHTVRAFYLLFHYLRNDAALRGFLELDEALEQLILQSRAQREGGLLVLGVHMCYFDLALQGLARRGLRAFALSLPETTPAIDWQHSLRQRAGVEIVPATPHNLRWTVERLRAGEIGVTGIDRPIPNGKYKPHFFGRPANLPVHYIQLAINAGAPVQLLAPVVNEQGRIRVLAAPQLEMVPCADRREELLVNAERVLAQAEQFIAAHPEQWGMTWPVWNEVESNKA